MKLTLTIVWLCIAGFAAPAFAEVFIYTGPNGEKLFSDRPVARHEIEYRLIKQQDTLRNAGKLHTSLPIATGGSAPFKRYIKDASKRHRVDPILVEAIILVESGFDPNAVSSKGASGLMQLMKDTAKRYKVRDRFDPRENINGGVQHLKYLIDRFDGDIPLVLAAYNAGAGNVDKYQGVPPFPETQRYVTKVMGQQFRLRQALYGGQ